MKNSLKIVRNRFERVVQLANFNASGVTNLKNRKKKYKNEDNLKIQTDKSMYSVILKRKDYSKERSERYYLKAKAESPYFMKSTNIKIYQTQLTPRTLKSQNPRATTMTLLKEGRGLYKGARDTT